MTVIYELATPIETPLSSTELATYAQLVTNNPSTTVLNDSGADMSVEYYTAKKEKTVEHIASGFGRFCKELWSNNTNKLNYDIGNSVKVNDIDKYTVFALELSEKADGEDTNPSVVIGYKHRVKPGSVEYDQISANGMGVYINAVCQCKLDISNLNGQVTASYSKKVSLTDGIFTPLYCQKIIGLM
jgi:hypothetical protein